MRKIIIAALAAAALSGCVEGPSTPRTGPTPDNANGDNASASTNSGPKTGSRGASDRKTNVREFSAAGMNLRSYDKGGLSYTEHRDPLTNNGGR